VKRAAPTPGRIARWIALATLAIASPAAAEALVSTISSSHVEITSTYTGADLVVFGVIERDGRMGARTEAYDVVVTARGPDGNAVVREKVRLGPIWMNLDQRKFVGVPATLAVLSNRPVGEITETHLRRRYRLGLEMQVGPGGTDIAWDASFLDALLRLKRDAGLYVEVPTGVTFLTPTIFKAKVPVPATAPVGTYKVEVALLSGGLELARTETGFEVGKVGFEATVARHARQHGWFYGLITVAIALAFGYTASIIFRRD
jgi:uncharacterized protein (TIGR02186 family)